MVAGCSHGWEAAGFAFGRLNSAFPGTSSWALHLPVCAAPGQGSASLSELSSLLDSGSAQAPKRQILEAV